MDDDDYGDSQQYVEQNRYDTPRVLMERKRREKWRVPKANELPTRFVEQITLRAAVHSVRKERFDKNRNQTAEMLIIPDINSRMAMSGA